MSNQWYFSREGQNFGPYSWDELRGFVASGQVTAADPVWNEGMPNWIPAADVEGLVDAGPAGSPPAPATGGPGVETIAGIIPAMHRKSGLLAIKVYNLVLTGRQIIFAEATQQMMNQAVKEAAAEAKASGKGLLARAAETMKSGERVYKKYRQMSPEAILAETPGNFAIDLREIASVRVIQRSGLQVRFMIRDDPNRQQRDEMQIKTARETIKLTFAGGGAKEAKQLLQGLLGNLVR